MRKFMGGKGNVDNYVADKEGKFGQPVGFFENNVGHFFCRDSFKDILVVFRWDARDKENPVWPQAFSEDLGKTWDWNW